MKKNALCICIAIAASLLAGCRKTSPDAAGEVPTTQPTPPGNPSDTTWPDSNLDGTGTDIDHTDHTNHTDGTEKQGSSMESIPAGYLSLTTSISELESGFSAVKYEGDYAFDTFLEQGGAGSDAEVLQFLTGMYSGAAEGLSFATDAFGCSTISVQTPDGGYYFGRNFDWNKCDALVVAAYPEHGYASIATVNVGFIRQGAGLLSYLIGDELLTFAALYAPLDGMNEKGLCVSVNMIQDDASIAQDTGKRNLTTTTAIRLLLDQAATTDEAIALLSEHDFHASMNYMVHLAVADSSGNSVAIEYINNKMVVSPSPVLTNFYLAEGEKQGIGTKQSHTRFEILQDALDASPAMDATQVRDALRSVGKGNFGEFESTEWSVVFDQIALTADYYHRENYEKCYAFQLFPESGR